MDHMPMTWEERGRLWLRLGLRGILLLGGLALLVFVGLPLLSLLSPFVFALVLAWVLNPAVRWLQRHSGAPRKAVSMVLVILVFAVIGGVLFGLGWMAVDQVRSLFDNRQSVLDELLAHGVDIHDHEPPEKLATTTCILLRNLEEGRDLFDGFYGLDPDSDAFKPHTIKYRGKEQLIQPTHTVEDYRQEYEIKWRELEPLLRAYYQKG